MILFLIERGLINQAILRSPFRPTAKLPHPNAQAYPTEALEILR